MSTTHPTTLALATGLLLALSGCGGGGNGPIADRDPLVAGSQVPKSALASANGFVQFVGSLPPSETELPLAVGDIAPPVSEDGPPAGT